MKVLDFLSPGKRLKALRKQLNIKQVELEAIGVSRNYISMVESDKRNLTGKTLEKFLNFMQNKADAMDINVNLDTNYLLMPEKEEARNYCNMKLKSTLNHEGLNEVINIGKKYNLIDILVTVYFLKANLLYDEFLYDTAFIYYYNILDIYNNNNNDNNKGYIYLKLAICKLSVLSYEEALAYLFKSYFYCDKFNDKTNLQKCIFNIALTYKKINEYDNSLLYIDKFLNMINPKEQINQYIDAIVIKCNCYVNKGDFKTSIDIYNSTINYFDNIPNISLGYIYTNLGENYLNLNDLDQSLTYFDKAIQIRTLYDGSTLSHSLIDKAQVLIKQSLYKESVYLIKEGILLAEKYDDIECIIKSYELLEDIYIKLNDKDNLEEIYFLLIENLKGVNSLKLLGIYIKLSIFYTENNNIDKSKEFLYEAEKLQNSLK